LKLICQINYQC